ncbi:hypothetical protein GYMLUDRAFT_181161 [Collybiopsis luxurians FD-317 M1]|uniref:Uncharacterized protein n=1 Tax=Collybiopsis luxurians FD-317 M1 TaxID=944289 RepID=A0A0D0CA16_9AGAR|nr:hypothetical protein GYMLUDRAFT_181161 [Collybiopsis luxurians FD-317 M1]
MLIHPKDAREKESPRAARLTEIVMQEATALIWQLRNIHVIQHDNDLLKTPMVMEIQNQFLFRLSKCLELDLTLIDKAKFRKKPLLKTTVLETWQDTTDVNKPPDDWTKVSGVLVGMGRSM